MSNSIINRLANLKDRLTIVKDKKSLKEGTQIISDDKVNYIAKNMIEKDLLADKYIDKLLISNKYLKTVNKYDIDENEVNINLSNDEIIEYARTIIRSIDENLLDDFNSFVKNKSIKFKKGKKDSNKNISYADAILKEHYLSSEIELVKKNSYSTVCDLVHEFMHITNVQDNFISEDYKKIKMSWLFRLKYTEFISIFFEMYSKDYLIDKYNLSKFDFNKSERIIDNKNISISSLNYLPFLIYKEFGNITYDNYLEVIKKYDIEVEPDINSYNSIKNIFYDTFEALEENFQIIDKHPKLITNGKKIDGLRNTVKENLYSNNYLLSTLLYYRSKGIYNKNDVLKLSKLIRKANDIEVFKDPLIENIEEMYDKIKEDDIAFINLDEDLNKNFKKVNRGNLL
ncbi:MAG: hypothetical protein J5970_01980 [Bacilli bacterium]|nr:hypothetical protein [Bacilli bacterium]